LDSLAVTLSTLDDPIVMLNWLDDWLAEYEQMMLTSALVFINWAMQRGITYASTELNRLSPNYQTSAGWTPADDELRNELVEETNGYITEFISDLGTKLRGTLTSDKDRATMIGEIKDTLSVAKNNVDIISKTAIIDSFNEATRRRWKIWGVKKYRFWSSLDPVDCDNPKKLRDGRCTILPVIGGSQ